MKLSAGVLLADATCTQQHQYLGAAGSAHHICHPAQACMRKTGHVWLHHHVLKEGSSPEVIRNDALYSTVQLV
eukprot:5349710-Amphidinium_carterae.1